jgi:hypothetical protein
MMGVREFRDKFPNMTEPVRVIRATRGVVTLGTWTPDPNREDVKAAKAAAKGGK